jgi:putative toxin-antitoxin system antitoxin component (TIGR02293 family)
MKPASTSPRLKPKSSPQRFAWHGIVATHIHGPQTRAAAALRELPAVIGAVQSGLPFAEVEALRVGLDIPLERLAPKLGLSKATLHRRKLEGRLTPAESDRVIRYARLLGRAVDVLEGEEAARRWLNRPQYGLGGAIPLDYAETEAGAREVENVLGRIEYGVYS